MPRDLLIEMRHLIGIGIVGQPSPVVQQQHMVGSTGPHLWNGPACLPPVGGCLESLVTWHGVALLPHCVLWALE